MATTIKSTQKRGKTWTVWTHEDDFSFESAAIGWEALRMTMWDAFEIYAELADASGDKLAQAQANADTAQLAVYADIHAYADAVEREGGDRAEAQAEATAYYEEGLQSRLASAA